MPRECIWNELSHRVVQNAGGSQKYLHGASAPLVFLLFPRNVKLEMSLQFSAMAARGLLHHPLNARAPPSDIADPRYKLPRQSPSFFARFSGASFRRRPFSSSPTLQPVHCMKLENQGHGDLEARVTPHARLDSSNGGNPDLMELVNKAPPGPMVEVDPMTVFRRFVAERRASLAVAMAKHEAAEAAAMQSTASSPYLLGRNWTGKPTLAIVAALLFLALAAVFHFLRSRTDRDKQKEGEDDTDVLTNEGRKLVKDTIKAPESILTAMAIGAASVDRAKGHTGVVNNTPYAANCNVIDTRRPEEGVDSQPVVNTTATEGMKAEVHGNPGLELKNSDKLEQFGYFKAQTAGVDVSEGPWFAQAEENVGNLQLESDIQLASVVGEVEDALPQSQESPLSAEAAVEQLGEVSMSEVRYETQYLNDVVDGEFLGEVVSVNVATKVAVKESNNNVQVESFKFKEPEDDDVLPDSSAIVEKLEEMIGHGSVGPLEGMNVAGNVDGSEQKLSVEEPRSKLSSDQMDEMVWNPSASLEASDSAVRHDGEGPVRIGSNHFNGAVAGQAPDDVSVATQTKHAEFFDPISRQNPGGMAYGSRVDAALQSSEEDPREDSKRALEAAMPAVAIGIGTVGALCGAAGGLQVVGFAALVSFVSRDVFWAQSREELWQELKGITDRQKLLDFMARRNIVRKDGE